MGGRHKNFKDPITWSWDIAKISFVRLCIITRTPFRSYVYLIVMMSQNIIMTFIFRKEWTTDTSGFQVVNIQTQGAKSARYIIFKMGRYSGNALMGHLCCTILVTKCLTLSLRFDFYFFIRKLEVLICTFWPLEAQICSMATLFGPYSSYSSYKSWSSCSDKITKNQ